MSTPNSERSPTVTAGRPKGKSNSSRRQAFACNQIVAERYRIVRFLGAGGMGEVYEAWDLLLREPVACKTLRATRHGTIDSKAARYFRREASVARKVTHKNVCRVLEFGIHQTTNEPHQDLPFIVMELMHGEPLSDYLKRKRILPSHAVHQVALQACAGLAAIHASNALHRDIKPENLFVEHVSENVRCIKITDFGLARLTSPEAGVITSGSIGTVAYMAPEIFDRAPASPASDVWSLGLTLYQLLTGHLPERDLQGVTRFDRHVPIGWIPVLTKCLQRQSQDRFQSAGELLVALRAANPQRRGYGKIGARQVSSLGRSRRWWLVVFGVLVGAAVAVLIMKAR